MLSELIFSKKLNEIQLLDLEEFFSEKQEESSILEFKTGKVSIENIFPEICAFLNTEGGVLIIGTPIEQKEKSSKHSEITYCQGELISSSFRNKDWLMQKIASNITPMPTGIKIQELLTETGNYFIVDVPQSITPPHQCGNGTYYIRLEREAKPAPHGLVEALFFKRQKPKLNIKIELEHILSTPSIFFKLRLSNLSPYPTEKSAFNIHFVNVRAVFCERTDIEHALRSSTPGIYDDQHTTDSVLWEGVSWGRDFIVRPKDEPFLYTVSAWSRDASIINKIDIIDPRTFESLIDVDLSGFSEVEKGQYLSKILKEYSKKNSVKHSSQGLA